MFRGHRGIRLRTILIAVAGCAIVCGLGVQVYRELSPVRRSTRQLRPGNSAVTRIAAVSCLDNPRILPPWERQPAYRILLATINDPEPRVRARAAVGLGSHPEHTAEVVSTLIALLQDQALEVRESALVALERMITAGSPERAVVAEAVVSALDDPKPAVRLEAARALHVFGQGKLAVAALARLGARGEWHSPCWRRWGG